MRLASTPDATQRRRPTMALRPSRPSTSSTRTSKAAAQAKALLLFGRWLRVSRRGISVMNGCGCGFDTAIELGELDVLILDYLQQKFSKAAAVKGFVCIYIADEKKNGIQRLLEALANGDHKLQADAAVQLLDAIEVSVASIEENHV